MSDTHKDRKKSAHWTDADTEILIGVLLNHKDSGRTSDNGFKPYVWREASDLLEGETTVGGPKTAEACKSRWQRLQRDYKAAKEFEAMPGFTWDNVHHKLSATPEVWEAAHKITDALKFQKLHLPSYDSIGILCPIDNPRSRNMLKPRASVPSTSGSGNLLSQTAQTMSGDFSGSASGSGTDMSGMHIMDNGMMQWGGDGDLQSGFNQGYLRRNEGQPVYQMNTSGGSSSAHQHDGPSTSKRARTSNSGTQSLSHSPVTAMASIPAQNKQQQQQKSARQSTQASTSNLSTQQSSPGQSTVAPQWPASHTSQSGQSINPHYRPVNPHMSSHDALLSTQAGRAAAPITYAPVAVAYQYETQQAGMTDQQRRTQALIQLQTTETDMRDEDLLEVMSEFEENVTAADTYLAIKKESLRRLWLNKLVDKRRGMV